MNMLQHLILTSMFPLFLFFGSEEPTLKEARIDVSTGNYHLAAVRLERILGEYPKSRHRSEMVVLLIKSYALTQREAKAIPHLRTLMREFPEEAARLDPKFLKLLPPEPPAPPAESAPKAIAGTAPPEPAMEKAPVSPDVAPVPQTVEAPPAVAAAPIPPAPEPAPPVLLTQPADIAAKATAGSAQPEPDMEKAPVSPDVAPVPQTVEAPPAVAAAPVPAAQEPPQTAPVPAPQGVPAEVRAAPAVASPPPAEQAAPPPAGPEEAPAPVVSAERKETATGPAPLPTPPPAGETPAVAGIDLAGGYTLFAGEVNNRDKLARVTRILVAAGLQPHVSSRKRNVEMHRLVSGCYRDSSEALKRRKELAGASRSAFIFREGNSVCVAAGSFASTKIADQERKRLAVKGIDARVVPVNMEMPYWSITAGRFPDAAAAEKAMQKVPAGRLKIVVRPITADPPQ